jgi:hypothetical protein
MVWNSHELRERGTRSRQADQATLKGRRISSERLGKRPKATDSTFGVDGRRRFGGSWVPGRPLQGAWCLSSPASDRDSAPQAGALLHQRFPRGKNAASWFSFSLRLRHPQPHTAPHKVTNCSIQTARPRSQHRAPLRRSPFSFQSVRRSAAAALPPSPSPVATSDLITAAEALHRSRLPSPASWPRPRRRPIHYVRSFTMGKPPAAAARGDSKSPKQSKTKTPPRQGK